MEPASPLPPPRRYPAGFSLPPLAWVVGGVCAFAPLAGLLGRAGQGTLTWGAAVSGVGIAAGLVALPAALAWLVWRSQGRGQVVVFGGVLALLILGLGVQGFRRSATEQSLLEIESKTLADNIIHRAPIARAPAATGPVADARRAVKARFDAARLVYEIAVEGVDPARFFDLTPLALPEMIAARRAQVEAFSKANDLLHDAAGMGAFYFTSELRDRGLSEDVVRAGVDIYRAATEKLMPRLKRLRDKDDALAALMRQYLDFAEGQHGRWRVAGGQPIFDDPTAAERHAALQRTAKVLLTERDRLKSALR